jgi:hypothetical protein
MARLMLVGAEQGVSAFLVSRLAHASPSIPLIKWIAIAIVIVFCYWKGKQAFFYTLKNIEFS